MTPLKLTLKGFIGIRDGMGRSELTLDFATVKGALVAITGPNGIGKTTVLDNLQPYRIMPSRASSYGVGGFSFWGQVYGAEASKELVWSHAGATYRSILIFRSTGKTQKAEAYLQRLHAEGSNGSWEPYIAQSGVISDGKTTTYDICIEAILGSPELYFTAAFSAQGRRLLSGYTNGEIKSLLSSLLGLDRLGMLATAANEKRLMAERSLAGIRERGSEFAGIGERVTQKTVELSAQREQSITYIASRDAARTRVGETTSALWQAQAWVAAATESEIRRSSLRQQLETLNRQEETELTEARIARDTATAAVIAAQQRVETETRRLNQQLAGQESDLKAQTDLLARADEINTTVAKVEIEAASLTTLEANLKVCEASGAELKDAPAKAAAAGEKVNSLQREVQTHGDKVKDLQRRSALVDTVPCAGMDLQSSCDLLKDARAAKDQLGTVEAEHLQKVAAHQQACTDAMVAQEQAGRHAELQRQWRELNDKRNALLKIIDGAKALAALKPGLDQAQAAADRIRSAISETRAAIVAATEAGTAELARLREASVTANQKPMDVQKRYQEIRAPIEADLASVPTAADATTAVTVAEQALVSAKSSLDDAERAIEAATTINARLNAELAQLQALAEKAASFEADVAAAAEDLAHWTTLCKALGPNGVVALVIDDAGPSLAALTNDLLRASYGPRFSVRIDTQHENTDGTLREDFDIVVFDADRGEAKSITDLSGGERIWNNDALCSAIAVYMNQQSGRNYECRMSDEADGALDAEKKQQYMAMKREVLKIAGLDREFFISHSPSTWALADAVIDLSTYILQPQSTTVQKAA